MLQRPGGSGALLKDTSVVVLKEDTPPTNNPCQTWDSNPQPSAYKSDSLSIRPRLPPDVTGLCDKSCLLISCELSAWMKKIMPLLTNYKVSKQLTRLDITDMCHVKIKLEMAWNVMTVSFF